MRRRVFVERGRECLRFCQSLIERLGGCLTLNCECVRAVLGANVRRAGRRNLDGPGLGAGLTIGIAVGSACQSGWSGCSGVGSVMSVEIQAVGRF